MIKVVTVVLSLSVASVVCVDPYSRNKAAEPQISLRDTSSARVVSAKWLRVHLNHPGVVVVDCHYDRKNTTEEVRTFESAHIPGAVHLEIEKIGNKTEKVRRAFLPNIVLQEYIRQLGIDSTSHVVLYDHSTSGLSSAPRAWFVLQTYGHSNVSILDGGVSEWKKMKYPVESGQGSQPKIGNFTAKFDNGLVATYEEVTNLVSNPTEQLLDARPAHQYADVHIQTAISAPSGSFFDENGLIFTTGRMRSELKAKGVRLDGKPIAYCNSAMGSSVLTFLLRHIGIDTRNFNGAIHQVIEQNPELLERRPGTD